MNADNKDQFTLLDIARIVQKRWRLVIFTGIIFLSFGLIYLHIATYRYSVELILAPVTSNSQPHLSTQLSNLAALGGITINNEGAGDQFARFVEDINSRGVADALANNRTIMTTVFAGEWNRQLGQWGPQQGALHTVGAIARFVVGVPTRSWHPPGGAELQVYIRNRILIIQSAQNPFLTIKILSKDPVFGEYFLEELSNEVNSVLKRQVLTRTDAQIRYLTKTLQTVTVTEHRAALTQALLEQERMRMAASSSLPFAAEPLGPPSVSLQPVSPNPAAVIGVALLAGVFLGIFIALVMSIMPPDAITLRYHIVQLWLRTGEIKRWLNWS